MPNSISTRDLRELSCKRTSVGREHDDSILQKVCNSLATQHPTVFAFVWPSGIDCARETPPPAYTPGMSSIGQKAPC